MVEGEDKRFFFTQHQGEENARKKATDRQTWTKKFFGKQKPTYHPAQSDLL
jgi:hypothetical protein